MAGTAKVYFANRLSLKVNDGSTDHTLAILHGCEVIWEAEHIEEYGMDSTLREDVSKVKQKVRVKIKYAKFNPIVTEWWQMQIIRPSGATGAMEDTNTVKLFDITGILTDGAASPQKFQAVIDDCYFPTMPMVFAENQYVVHDLEAIGKSITSSNPA